MSTDLEKLEELKKLTMELVRSQKRFDKLSEKRCGMSLETHTERAIQNANAALDWHAMKHDQLFRQVHAVSVDCGLSRPKDDYGEIEYNPSHFHKYRYQPRVPLCRQSKRIQENKDGANI
jgi:hypothetical protein